MRELYENATGIQKRRMWFNAYLFAVLSIQSSVERHEKAFKILNTELKEIEDYQDKVKVRKALYRTGLIFYNLKTEFINSVATKLVLNEIEIDITMDNFKTLRQEYVKTVNGLGYAKASFMMALLGYPTICIDTWIAKYLGLDKTNKNYDVDLARSFKIYQRAENRIIREFKKTLAQYSDNPFLYQWILFDYSRDNGITYHDIYFEINEKVAR